jgi:hypothetical protein
LTSIRDIQSLATHVRNAQIAAIRRGLGERIRSTPSGSSRSTNGSAASDAKQTLRTDSLRLVADYALAAAGLHQRREQRLRLGDHRHLRRRRKAFERGRKDSVGFDETVGRLIKLGERKRRKQLEGPGALLFRDSEGGFESVFGLRRVGVLTLQKDIGAAAGARTRVSRRNL